MGSPPEDEPLELAFDPRTRRAAEAPPAPPVVISAPRAPEPEAAPAPRGPKLPAPVGVRGHWAYTLATWEWFRGWRGRVAAEDAAVRTACDARDEAFMALGGTSLAPENAAATAGDAEVGAFAATLARFDAESRALASRRAESLAAAERANTDTAAAMTGFDERISEVRAAHRPHETALRLLEGRLEDTRRQRAAVEARAAKGPDARVTADRERFEAEFHALESQIDEKRRAVAVGRRQVEALEHEQHLVRKAGAQEVASLEGRATQASEEILRLAERRRAALMDLGHEVLRRGLSFPADGGAVEAARLALAALDAARDHRERVLAERREIDLAPCVRTLAAAVMLAVGLALLVVLV
jgi:hypothetical protein